MTATEIGVTAVGLLLGYWLVSFFLKPGGSVRPPADAPPTQSPTEPMERPQPWHEVLQLAPDAGTQQIREAYFRLAAQYQPDAVQALGPEIRELAARRLEEIETAYQEALRGTGGAA
jgi:DnaJ like chaperone protein